MIRVRIPILFLLLCCFWKTNAIGQTQHQRNIDSLSKVLNTDIDDTTKINIINTISDHHRLAGETEKSKQYAEKAYDLSIKLNYKYGEASALNMLGLFEYGSGNFQDAIDKFNMCLKINQEIGRIQNVGHNLNNIGNIHWTKGDFQEAMNSYRASLKAYEEVKDTIGILRIANNMGAIFQSQGNYPEALKYTLESLKLALTKGTHTMIGMRYLNIGGIYTNMKNYAEAMKNFDLGLTRYKEAGNKSGIAEIYGAIGKVNELEGQYTESLNNYSIALKFSTETGVPDLTAKIYNNIGSVYLLLSDYNNALVNFNYAISMLEKMEARPPLSFSYIKMGEVLSGLAAVEKKQEVKSKKFNEAISMIQKGLLLAKKTGAKENIKDGYAVLSKVYKIMNDYESALKYSNLYSEIKDSLLNNETTRKLEQQRTQYEVEKAVAEEKVQQEKTLVEQKFKSEKELADKNAKHQIELAEEKAQKEKAIEIEKLKYEFTLSEERTEQEKILAEQKFENERKLGEENASHQQAMTEQKVLQQKKDADAKALLENEKADRKRKNELMLIGFGAFFLISTFVALLIRQRNLIRRAVERAEAGHKMAELELQSLRAQLNPHFMFNSLNAIQDLIVNENTEKSHLYLSRFSKLLRMLLDNANQPFVTVKQELELLELYLSLENLRIPNLEYSIEKDPKMNTDERMIPNMMLQPYIENAIWHGLSNKKGERKLQIRIQENGTATEFEVEDNGIGRKKSAELKQQFRHGHHSKGMQLLSKRFELLSKEYGTSIQTTITDLENNGDAAGTLVRIDVPFTLSVQAKQLVNDTNHHN